jgi:TfoX/Sxy family transcriptional regulator of competence genes
MAYDDDLANRVREQLADEHAITERAMFGGLAFMLAGNMAVGINRDDLMVRLAPEDGDAALDEPHTRVFDMTGRPMKGWIVVESDGVATDEQLKSWVARGTAFARTLPPKG